MKKISFTNLSPDAQKAAIMEAFRSVWYLDTVLDKISMDVKDAICERFRLLYSVFCVEPMFSSFRWSIDGDYPIPSVMVRLQSTDDDDLKDFVRSQLKDRVQFSFDERDIIGVDALYMNNFSSGRIECSLTMKEINRVALEDVLSGMMSLFGHYAEEYAEKKAKEYFSSDVIREHLESLDMDYTKDGRLIFEYDEQK
jgi:hypothetical protein